MRQKIPLLGSLLLLSTLLLSGPLGCEETATSPKTATADTNETTPTDFNLQVTMDELAAVLKKRSELLQKLLQDPQAFTRYHADLVSQTFYDERRLTDLIYNHLRAEPRSLRLVCRAYDTTVREAQHQASIDFAAVSKSKQCGTNLAAKIYKSDYSQRAREDEAGMSLMLMGQGIRRYYEKFPEYRDNKLQGAIDLELLCIKSKWIEESFNPAK